MYVQRNEQGVIVGAFANLQIGFAESWVADDSPELLAFYSPPELIQQAANAKRDELLALAAIRIAPRQDAVDLGVATSAEGAELLAWKTYRIDLNRIEQQAGFPGLINWPLSPDETQAH